MRFNSTLIGAYVYLNAIFSPTYTNGQSLLSSSSGHLVANNLEIDYVIGELAVNALTIDSILLTQGFLQQYLQLVNSQSLKDPFIELFPNPVTEVMHLRDSRNRALKIQVWQIPGSLIYSGSAEPVLDCSKYPPGTYLIKILTEQQTPVSNYIIVKI